MLTNNIRSIRQFSTTSKYFQKLELVKIVKINDVQHITLHSPKTR